MDAEKQFYTVKLPGGCKPDPSMTNRDAMKSMFSISYPEECPFFGNPALDQRKPDILLYRVYSIEISF